MRENSTFWLSIFPQVDFLVVVLKSLEMNMKVIIFINQLDLIWVVLVTSELNLI